MLAKDVMTTKLVTTREETPVHEAARLMSEHDVSALPIVDDAGTLIGIVSEADLIRRSEIGTELTRPWWLEAVTPAFTLAKDFVRAHGNVLRNVMGNQPEPGGEMATVLELRAIADGGDDRRRSLGANALGRTLIRRNVERQAQSRRNRRRAHRLANTRRARPATPR